MTQLKRTLHFLVILSIILLVLSYAISINMEMGLCVVNSAFVSNNFLFTCFSGAFASTLVLIANEAYHFIQTKKNVEQFMFNQLVSIYVQLQIANITINDLLSEDKTVAYNSLEYLSNSISQITPSLYSLDYNPIIKNNQTRIIKNLITKFVSVEIPHLDSLVGDCVFLKIAIDNDKLDTLRNGKYDSIALSSFPNTNKTLKFLNDDFLRLKDQIALDLTEFNDACDNRFHWNDIEKRISQIPATHESLTDFFTKHNKYQK